MDNRQPYRFEDSNEFYSDYFDHQRGNGFGAYAGRSVMGGRGQSGAGFGSILGKLARKVLPYAKTVGKRLLTETAGMAEDLLDGQSFESSAKRRLTNAGRGIVADFSAKKRLAKGTKMSGNKSKKKKKQTRSTDIFA